MSTEQVSESKGWWQTLPGLLTAAATVITAVAGLLVALHQVGFFARNPQPSVQTASESHPIASQSVESPSSTAATAPRALTIPGNAEVHSGQAVFKLLSAHIEPYSPDKVSVRFTVRYTNNDRFDANFWAASFRLLVDGSLQAPTNNLDELVPGNSSKEGDVEFVVPANVSTVGLQMGDVGDGKPSIAIQLQHP